VDVGEHIEALQSDGVLLADAAAQTGPEARVPSCPEWVVRDLVRHLGGVHRWAAAIVGGPKAEPVGLDEVVGQWPSDDDLVEWFRQGHGSLIDTLSNADPALSCWTFLAAPSPLAMWSRRQAHETAIHRVDAELAAGATPTAVPAQFAADGIDELLTCFITRPGRGLRTDRPRSLAIGCADARGNWLLQIGPDGVETRTIDSASDTDCQVQGTADDLYLCLWNRGRAEHLAVVGDRSLLDLFLDQVHVRWS
jgi:uncharacterized protein (TIGR03083 family)